MTTRITSAHLLLLAASTIALGAAAPQPRARAQESQQFEQAEIFFELNNTDGDLGLHAAIDGETWTELDIDGPGGKSLLNLMTKGQLRNQGLTQLDFESAEPTFDELSPEEFFQRFPEGTYEIEGRSIERGEIKGTVQLSQVLAAPPQNVTVSGQPAAESCDTEPLPSVSAPVMIRWDPVTQSHPEIGKPGPIEISKYQLFVEREGVAFSVDLPPHVTEFQVPTGITDLGNEFKFEIIARTTTGNNTAIESCFRLQ
jgi:hypothetical protein